MAMSPKLVMRQSQSLVMTPQLSQSIKLLAMSNIELSAFVEDELEQNPFLERDRRADGETEDKRGAERPAEQGPDLARELSANDELEVSADRLAENLGTSLENIFPDEIKASQVAPASADMSGSPDARISSSGLAISSNRSSHDSTVADHTAGQTTLRDHLGSQLAITGANPTSLGIAKDIIDNLDDAGYLRVDTQDIADRLGATVQEVDLAVSLVQSLEPSGVGARNLAECLKLQLIDKNRLDPAMAAIIDNLDCLANRDFAALRQITGLDVEDLHDALLEIQQLDPKPGTVFESQPLQHVSPDVIVREGPDGAWLLELNNETLPRVLINNTYVTSVSGKLDQSSDKEFIAHCLQTANWLTKSLDQRAQTILKVAREIVKQQDAFFAYGVQHLKPATLKAVADEIEMHESTVSRVTTNKYMMTPRGLFELKYFFTSSISSTENGESHSSEAVRSQIRALIENETASKVLSDDALVAALRAGGVDIARRTVAKYREAMHIPSSVQRRREKKASAMASKARAANKGTD